MSQGEQSLRELINDTEILILPAIYDGFSARLVASLGFRAACISGAGLSEARLGLPDVGIIDLSENVAATQALVAAAEGVPLIADGDTGYGNAVNVYYSVQKFERTGAAGVMLEDQVEPKRCGHMAGKEVIDANEMVGKLAAAMEARSSADFVIEARTDAAGVLGIDEAIRRGNLYADAGADLVIADALLSRVDIARFAAEVKAPVAVNMGFGIRSRATTPLISARELQDLGVAVVGYSRLLSGCALRGMRRGLDVLMRSIELGTVLEEPDLVASFDEINDLMGIGAIHEIERRHLAGQTKRSNQD
jgi:2-methylisocitrate lyase-like PEP mutase family enzyme